MFFFFLERTFGHGSGKGIYILFRLIKTRMKHTRIFKGLAYKSVTMSPRTAFLLASGLSLVFRLASADSELDRNLEETVHEMMGQPHFPSYAYTMYTKNMNYTEERPWSLYGMGWTHGITRFVFNITHKFGYMLPIGWFCNYCTMFIMDNYRYTYRLYK